VDINANVGMLFFKCEPERFSHGLNSTGAGQYDMAIQGGG
jgi:hypothetical protein